MVDVNIPISLACCPLNFIIHQHFTKFNNKQQKLFSTQLKYFPSNSRNRKLISRHFKSPIVLISHKTLAPQRMRSDVTSGYYARKATQRQNLSIFRGNLTAKNGGEGVERQFNLLDFISHALHQQKYSLAGGNLFSAASPSFLEKRFIMASPNSLAAFFYV